MAVTTNSAGLSLMNLYKMNLAANQEPAEDPGRAQEKTAENEDYQVRISEQAQQLAQQAKIRNGHDMTPPAVQETDPALNRSRFEVNTRNRAEATQLAVQALGTTRYGIEVVA